MIRVKNNTFLFYLFLTCVTIFFVECGKKKSAPEVIRETGTVKDIQGNEYMTVKIGNQWWMTENLKVKVYNDSTPIVEIPSDNDTLWAKQNNGAFCSVDKRFGLHYNWFVIKNKKGIAPSGWHIPSDEEWKILETELGMTTIEADKTSWRGINEGEKLMPLASAGWPASPNVYGSNESGFSALPGGCRLFNGTLGEVTTSGYWWSSTEKGKSIAWYRNLSMNYKTIFRYYVDKNYGLTIRCVKD